MAGFMLSLFLRLREQKNGGAGVGAHPKARSVGSSDRALRLIQSGARGLSIGSQG